MVALSPFLGRFSIPNAVSLPGPYCDGRSRVGDYFQDVVSWEIERLIGTAFEAGYVCRSEIRDICGRWWLVSVEPLENDFAIEWTLIF